MTADRAPDGAGAKEVQLEGLSSKDWQVRRAAVNRLIQSPDPDTLERLLQVLRQQHQDLGLVNAAIQVLGSTAIDVVPDLIPLLEHPDADLRCYVALTLGERGDPRAIMPLLKRLSDDDSNVRTQSIESLGKLRAGAAVDPLSALLEEPAFEYAFAAIEGLKCIGDRRIAHRLVALLESPMYRAAAIEALGELGDESVVKPLLDHLGDPAISPGAIAHALARVHEHYEQTYGAAELIPSLVRRSLHDRSINLLLTEAAGVGDVGRLAVVLSWIPGDEVDRSLVSLLERCPADENVIKANADRGKSIAMVLIDRLPGASLDLRRAIVEVLLRISDPRTIPALVDVLESDRDEITIARVLETLTRMSEPRLAELALRHFGHASARVRQAAIAAFSCLRDETAAEKLLGLATDESPLVRASAIRAAAYLGDPGCGELVIAGCSDPDERVQRSAIEQLANIEDERSASIVAAALRSEKAAVRAAAVVAVAGLEDPSPMQALAVSALADRDVWVRYFAVRTLGKIGLAPLHISALAHLAECDPAMQVRIGAVEMLGSCGPDAFRALEKLGVSEVEEVARAAILALARTGHAEAFSWLTRLPPNSSVELQQQLLEGLAITRDVRAIELLRNYALGVDCLLSFAAIRALSSVPMLEAAGALVETFEWPHRRHAAVEALLGMPSVAVEALAGGLQHRAIDVRRCAVQTLARLRSSEAVNVLEAALQDNEPGVRQAAIAALAHLGRRGRSPHVLKGEGRR